MYIRMPPPLQKRRSDLSYWLTNTLDGSTELQSEVREWDIAGDWNHSNSGQVGHHVLLSVNRHDRTCIVCEAVIKYSGIKTDTAGGFDEALTWKARVWEYGVWSMIAAQDSLS